MEHCEGVQLASDRRFRFPVAPEVFWSAIGSTDEYARWWPWLIGFRSGAERGLVGGDVWSCIVRPPLPYTLRFAVHLDDVEAPTLVTAHVTGDIGGHARLEVAPDGDGCTVRLISTLAPTGRAFAIVATLARPVVRRGHDWVLDTGARQFAARALI